MATTEAVIKTCDTCKKQETEPSDTFGGAPFRNWIGIEIRKRDAAISRKEHLDFCGHNCALAFLTSDAQKKR